MFQLQFIFLAKCWTYLYFQQAHLHKGFGVCFDVDGVLIQGQYVLPEAREALKLLTHGRKFQYPVLFVTNSSAKDSDKAAMLSDAFNIDVSCYQEYIKRQLCDNVS